MNLPFLFKKRGAVSMMLSLTQTSAAMHREQEIIEELTTG